MNFREKYGQWAFVAGGSVGMGGAYCDYLARQGMDIIVTGRHLNAIETKRRQLEENFGVQTRGIQLDLGDLDALEQVKKRTEGLEVGFLVYNAGIASMELFPDRDIEFEMYRLNVNVRSALALSLWFSKGMMARGRGGIVLMSSSSGVTGTPFVQTYSATKAYNLALGEALWGELSEYGIDVMAVLPGNTIGQSFTDVPAGTPGFQTGTEVVEEAFARFGTDPCVMTGKFNRDQAGDLFNVEARKEHIMVMKQYLDDIRKGHGTGTDTERADQKG